MFRPTISNQLIDMKIQVKLIRLFVYCKKYEGKGFCLDVWQKLDAGPNTADKNVLKK